MVRFDLFVNEGEVWVAEGYPNHFPEDEKPYSGSWPVEVWLTVPDDNRDGSWLNEVRKHCTLLEDYPHDYEHTACRVSVPTPADFVWLDSTVTVEDSVPVPLYAF